MGFCMWDGVGVAEMFFIDSRSMSHGFKIKRDYKWKLNAGYLIIKAFVYIV